MQSFMLYILYYVFVYNTVSCIYAGCFLLVPPILLEYGTHPPSTQNFCKVPYWPPSTPKLFYVQNRFSTKTAKYLAKFWY